MFFKEDPEKNQKEIDQLLKRNQEASDQIMQLFDELDCTPELLEKYLNDRENFTAEEWEMMESKKREMNEKLERDLNHLPNPEKTREAYALRRKTSNWLQV